MRTGCREIDEEALLSAGFERGCVVGVSAEDVDFGVLIGLQTIAHSLVSHGAGNDDNDKDKDVNPRSGRPRAAIITTLAVTAILPLLRDVIKAQVLSKLGPTAALPGAVGAEVRACLECISISQVFDIEGLWEVITELEMPPSPPEQPVDREAGGGGARQQSRQSHFPNLNLSLSRNQNQNQNQNQNRERDRKRISQRKQKENHNQTPTSRI
ncbi:putative fasciclin domain family protein [Eutypa lata UCREL1]|uniref:Putative fasciclin domain family protein n=1 Tax=Eutypa lata (strain UCR-EL1) TaxID=1287681 RepID=M7SYQ0_EUTLA|nr:putative fasciclin domain family protein [Eutypa lata UCREL1]